MLKHIEKNTKYPFDLYELIHSKTSIMLFLTAFNLHMAEFISFKPDLMIWDLYIS